MTRQDVILDFIRKIGVRTEMLEIGVDYGDTWHHQRGLIVNYTGVDISLSKVSVPMNDPRSHWFEMPSSQFWKRIELSPPDYTEAGRWNLIFVDGDHGYESALLDVTEGLKHLSAGGYLLIHDCDIPENGPCRAFTEAVKGREDIDYYVLPLDVHSLGVGVIHRKKERVKDGEEAEK